MKFFFFHLMPWVYLDPEYDKTFESAWVTLPNSMYDPQKGTELYNRYLDELEMAEELGFDGICVNEHHQNAYGNMPSPNIMAAALSRRTKKAKIAVLGNALPLREHPLRVAEEIAMMDVITGGRIISGFVRGIGAEYHVFGVNPTQSRDRFMEAHDLIMRAWQEEGPFEFIGKYYRSKYVNIWPRPVQRPYPPIWIPSQGSGETIEWSAERKYTYLQTFSPVKAVRKYLNQYKEEAEKLGYEASPDQLGWAMPIYVAETDEIARKEAKYHIEFFWNKLLRMPPEFFFPPGYLTKRSMKSVLEAKKGLSGEGRTMEKLMDEGSIIVGSAATVRDQLKQYHSEIGFGNLVSMMQFGTLPHDLTVKNLQLFASEVMPHLRDL
jgi:alkanesulfonate monooxygenase SsuD/methylene tetrahydromethanopterin reductase-like flavin-dependent oxidoreductase (luciferase family)